MTALVSFIRLVEFAFVAQYLGLFWVLGKGRGGISSAGSSRRTPVAALVFQSSLSHISLTLWLLSTLEILCLQETESSPQSQSEDLKC